MWGLGGPYGASESRDGVPKPFFLEARPTLARPAFS